MMAMINNLQHGMTTIIIIIIIIIMIAIAEDDDDDETPQRGTMHPSPDGPHHREDPT